MKLRIQNDHIRIRLTIQELESLADGDSVSMITPFCNSYLKTSLMTGTSAPYVRNLDHGIFIAFPFHYYLDLKDSDDEGFEYQFHFTNNTVLNVSIEKDYKCIGRSEKKNQGLFPHPKEESSIC